MGLSILMNTQMVQATLGLLKTQTMRVINPQPDEDGLVKIKGLDVWHDTSGREHKCPYGKPGDQLYVREAWRTLKNYDSIKPSDLGFGSPIEYKDGSTNVALKVHEAIVKDRLGRWRPSIHMPRWVSRIDLLVLNIRVMKVQDITTEEALDEGINHYIMNDPRMELKQLWDSINKKRGFGWDENPWVRAIKFELINR